MKWCGHHGKRLWGFSKKKKKSSIYPPYNPAIPLLGMHPKESELESQRDDSTLMFIAALVTMAKTGKQSEHLPTDEWSQCGVCMHGASISSKKEGNVAICVNRGGSRGHSAKREYPAQRTRTACGPFVWVVKSVGLLEAEDRVVVAKGQRKGETRSLS